MASLVDHKRLKIGKQAITGRDETLLDFELLSYAIPQCLTVAHGLAMGIFCLCSLKLDQACFVLTRANLSTLGIKLNLHSPEHLPIVPLFQCLVVMLIPVGPGEVKSNFFSLSD